MEALYESRSARGTRRPAPESDRAVAEPASQPSQPTTLQVDEACAAIASMRVRGAAKIGRTAAAALGALARRIEDGTETGPPRELLRDAGRRLIDARPTAVTLRNAVNLTLDGPREPSDEVARAVEARAVRHVERSLQAAETIARVGADAIPERGVVLTHCHSSLAVGSILTAHAQGKAPRVFADETRPWHQGRITARLLHDAGVDVTFIVDSAAHQVMETEQVDVVLVGADTVTADGALYNKIGTRAVALGAASLDIPVVCCAGLDKFSPYSLRGEMPVIEERGRDEVLPNAASQAAHLDDVPVRNPVFDRTDGRFIRHYLTEAGAIAPTDVEATIRRHFGTMEDWL